LEVHPCQSETMLASVATENTFRYGIFMIGRSEKMRVSTVSINPLMKNRKVTNLRLRTIT